MPDTSMDSAVAEAASQRDLAAALAGRKTMLLKSFRRDGSAVATPVSVAIDGERVYFRSYAETWKAKRLRRTPIVEVGPSTFRGKPRGPALRAQARLLHGDAVVPARRALARRHPLLQRVLVPMLHRLLGYTTLHYEVVALPRTDGQNVY